MKVVDVRATPVYVPLEAPLRWSMGVETGTVRTIIELITDEGLVGLGETYGGQSTVQAIERARPLFVGSDPFEVQSVVKRFEVFRVTSEQMVRVAELKYVGAGIEMALWDLQGKILNKPCAALWGGADRESIEFVAYVFYRYREGAVGGESSPQEIVDRYDELTERHGFRGLKLKGGVFPPEEELAAVRALRERHGDGIHVLRFDPNQAWSAVTAINTLRRMQEFSLEYVEDPTWDLQGMARVRHSLPSLPLATNQCVVDLSQVPPAIQMGAVDTILVDLYFWGGMSQARRLAAVCETFNIGLAIHSDRELGIGTAQGLHFVASTPQVCHAYDSHYHDQVGDVITEPFKFHGGNLTVPTGPGLGVELDSEQMGRFARLYEKRGDSSEFFDPRRPNWVPHLPLW